jgi:hypothetical protein
MKAKIDKLETNSKSKISETCYKGINDFMKGYQPRTNMVKDKTGDLVIDSTEFWIGGGTISLIY